METDTEGRAMMTAELARRIAEVRACDNIRELQVVAVDEFSNRALVLLVPRISGDASAEVDWQQPAEPFLMLIDSAALLNEHALH